MSDELREPPYNPWREFIENCISGDNYFRASEYHDLLDDLDRGYAAIARLSAAERDARRYRYLRQHHTREWVSDMPHDRGAPSLSIDFDAPGHDLDAAIDAALQDTQP